jgi:asparagine synthase (glutamine-hydrolysing)
MCGIFGCIDHFASQQTLEAIVAAALDSIRHRGPDGEGVLIQAPLAMGMRRLSILDIENGTQPFFSSDKNIAAFQNGEIYNFMELREELELSGFGFSSSCDTEVIAHGYAHWGMEGLLRRLDGMFAIAIVDRYKNKLVLARDRYGEKPLFVASKGRRFAYASSMLTLAALPWVDSDLDSDALLRYLCLGFVPGEATACGGIRRVPPGCAMEIDIDTASTALARYTAFPYEAPAAESFDADALDETLSRAVRSRLIADVPVGLFLSGGIDSSLIAHYAAKTQPGIHTFSIGFDDDAHDESVHAKAVARQVGARHHHFTFEKVDFLNLLPDVAEQLDEPVGDQACLPLLLLSRRAREYVTVVLSGEGADELFGGYFYYPQWIGAHLAPMPPILENPGSMTASGFPFMLPLAMAESWTPDARRTESLCERDMRQCLSRCPDMLRRARLCDILTWLPDDLLVKLDRMTMAASLEGRVPYLAPSLIPYLLMKPEACISGRDGKLPLRALAERNLPRSVWDRPKQGFVLPMRSWLKSWFAASGGGAGYCREHAIPALDNTAAANWIDSMLTGEDNVGWERSMFSLLMLYEWTWRFDARRRCLAGRFTAAGQ